jgi:hypothetical protein
VNERRFQITDDMQRQRLKQFLDRRELPFQCEIGPLKEPRSLSQNARLWALHTLAAAVTGYAPEEMHELMLCKFFGSREIECGGVRRTVPLKRSSARDKGEFRAFLENVENFYASELGCWLGQDEMAA